MIRPSAAPKAMRLVNRRGAMGLLAAAGGLAVAGGRGRGARAAPMLIQVGSGHTTDFGPTHVLDGMLPEIKCALAGAGVEADFDVAWGGGVAKVNELYDAVKDGLLLLAPVLSLFEPVKLAPLNVTYACPFAVTDVRELAKTAAVFEAPDSVFVSAWRAAGIEPLGSIWVDGYQLWSKKPISGPRDIAGLTIGASGYAGRWFEGLGAKVLAGSLVSFKQDVERGLIDAVASFPTGATGARLHAAVPVINRIDFGAQYIGTFGANLDWFNGLSPAAQTALRGVGRGYGAASAAFAATGAEAALTRAVAEGAHLNPIAPDQRQAWIDGLPDIPQMWARDLGTRADASVLAASFMKGLADAGVKPGRLWR